MSSTFRIISYFVPDIPYDCPLLSHSRFSLHLFRLGVGAEIAFIYPERLIPGSDPSVALIVCLQPADFRPSVCPRGIIIIILSPHPD